jgi:hypothetical protein
MSNLQAPCFRLQGTAPEGCGALAEQPARRSKRRGACGQRPRRRWRRPCGRYSPSVCPAHVRGWRWRAVVADATSSWKCWSTPFALPLNGALPHTRARAPPRRARAPTKIDRKHLPILWRVSTDTDHELRTDTTTYHPPHALRQPSTLLLASRTLTSSHMNTTPTCIETPPRALAHRSHTAAPHIRIRLGATANTRHQQPFRFFLISFYFHSNSNQHATSHVADSHVTDSAT